MRASKTKFIIKKSYYHHFLVGIFVFMVSFVVSAVVASIFAPVSESNAQTLTVDYANTGYYVSVTSADNVELSNTSQFNLNFYSSTWNGFPVRCLSN